MSKVIFGYIAVFDELVQNIMTSCEYTIKNIVSVVENVVEARQLLVAVSAYFASLCKRLLSRRVRRRAVYTHTMLVNIMLFWLEQ